MTYAQLRAVLLARWKLAAMIAAALFALTIAITFLSTPLYSSTSAVLVDLKSPDPINGTLQSAMYGTSYLATQVDLIRSQRVASKVSQALRLAESSILQDQWRESTGGRGDFNRWIAEVLLKRLEVTASRDSSIISITYSAPSPEFAAQVSNSFMKAYFEVAGDLRAEAARASRDLFDQQAMEAKLKLEDAQRKLTNFQREKGLVSTDERLDLEVSKLAELNSQLLAAQAVRSESTSRAVQGQNNVQSLPDVLVNPVVSQLKSDLARLESAQRELENKYGESYPDVVSGRDKISQIKSRIESESKKVIQGVTLSDAINRSRESEIRAQVERQKDKILQLKSERDESSLTAKEVDNLQRNYDAMLSKLAMSSLESKSTQTNLLSVQEATVSPDPSYPKIPLNLFIGIFGSLFVAMVAAVSVEMLNRRVLVPDDLEYNCGAPVLGQVPCANPKRFYENKREGLSVSLVGSLLLTSSSSKSAR